MKGKALAIFDFDGTLTYKDTMIEFVRFVKGSTSLYAGMALLSPWLAAYKAGLLHNQRAKEIFLSHFFKGEKIESLEKHGHAFGEKYIARQIRPAGEKRLAWHREQGHEVLVVTASLEFWVGPWLRSHGLRFLASRPQVINGRFTGKLEGPNCYGPEKVNRIRECLDVTQFDEIFAYGDSPGDREILAMASQAVYKPFR